MILEVGLGGKFDATNVVCLVSLRFLNKVYLRIFFEIRVRLLIKIQNFSNMIQRHDFSGSVTYCMWNIIPGV